MELEDYLARLQPRLREMFAGESTGHDLGHLERTMNAALYLQQREGGDRVVVGTAALLHDVHRLMEGESGDFVSPTDSLPLVRKLLRELDMPESQIEQVCYCVDNHERYNWNGDNVSDWNTLVVQDADNLDALGAVGIGRCFAWAAAHKLPMYNPALPLESGGNYSEYAGPSGSAIHNFYSKLFRLGANMNTETGRQLAEQKIAYMRRFVDDFLNEYNGQY